ncbi:uncharacterized protein DEA37_0013130 [Paragonimus westermani]|uniref:Uncharacterized protein n=1 Tax=Paragonimus westermani TaxID=34504 RepID=A0A5J4N7G6_9TREM|nr:uncharacterized protein DEA37_0013130 [Paragonimus westermani]
MWRLLLAYLHSPTIVKKLADSTPIRLAARFTVRYFLNAKNKMMTSHYYESNRDSLERYIRQLKEEIRRGLNNNRN